MSFNHLSDFELRQICYFLKAVAAGNNFTEAAKRLGIKQPPFSQSIQALEDKLSGETGFDVKLFDRRTRPPTLTEAGRAFLTEAEFALTHLDRAINQARRASQGEVGHLTIGIHNSAANSILPNVLRTFRKQYPDVELELREVTTHQEIPLLKEHQLDVVFHRSPSPYENDSDLVFIPILQESFLVVLPETHFLANQKQVSLVLLKNESMILPSLDNLPFYKQVIKLCQKAGFEPKIIQTIKATGIVTLLSLVAAEIGISILPSHVQVLHREGVTYRSIQDKMLGRHMTVVYRKADSSNVLQRFLGVIREVMELNSKALN